MTQPNTLIFVDWPATDAEAAGRFYAEVFGWELDLRLNNRFSRLVPGGNYLNPDGSESEVGNLHVGVYDPALPRPTPDPNPPPLKKIPEGYAQPRIYVLVSPDDTPDRIMDTAEKLGAEVLWRNHHWSEFKGFCHSFRDPWGTQIILWQKVGPNPEVPPHFTAE